MTPQEEYARKLIEKAGMKIGEDSVRKFNGGRVAEVFYMVHDVESILNALASDDWRLARTLVGLKVSFYLINPNYPFEAVVVYNFVENYREPMRLSHIEFRGDPTVVII